MSCRVIFAVSKGREVEGMLKYGLKESVAVISICGDDGRELFSDALTSFTTITVSENDALSLRLSGDNIVRNIAFVSEKDSSAFWTFLQNNATVTLLPGDCRVFLITETTRTSGYVPWHLPPAIASISRLVWGDPVNEHDSEMQTHVVKASGLSLGNVVGSLPDMELTKFSGNVKETVFSRVALNKADMERIWAERMSDDEHCPGDYTLIRRQWRTMTRRQWERSCSLRKFVVDVEKVLKEAKMENSCLIFDVLMSLSAFHSMNLVFDSNFVPFINLIIPIFVQKNAEDDTFVKHDGTISDFDEAAETLFWTFKSFVYRFVLSGPRMRIPELGKLFLSTKTMMLSVSPSTAAVLEIKGVTEFGFCAFDIASLFTANRDLDTARLFLTALVSNDDIPTFVQCVLCVIFVLIEERLRQLPDDDPDALRLMYTSCVPTIDVRLILYNVEELLMGASWDD